MPRLPVHDGLVADVTRLQRPGGGGETVRLTTAQALVRYLCAQQVLVDDLPVSFLAGVFAIFGHGNVLGLGEALYDARDRLPTLRGQNEQGMALAGVAYAKAQRRRRIMMATSSIGPGALNMVTAAGVAMANRLPLLIVSGDTFASRLPDPVLQQVEHFGTPCLTANDAFRAVTRYWDRITHPLQLISSLPQAVATLLDPADCGPVFLGLAQDAQAEAADFPSSWFEPVLHAVPRPRADAHQLAVAADILRHAQRPLIIAGGGVLYSLAERDLAAFSEAHRIPVVETMAGKTSLAPNHPSYAGPVGVTGAAAANMLAGDADVVLAVGTRLQDFTTGSWTVFNDASMRLISINTARFDTVKHRAVPVVGDAREALRELTALLDDWRSPADWAGRARVLRDDYLQLVADATRPATGLPTYAQVIGAVGRIATADDYVVAAAGGLPGELNVAWLGKAPGTFDCEYGFSCMGYEVAGGWGARLARPRGEVFVFVGDGSYLMMNSDLYSTILGDAKVIAILCDNGGYAVIERLQTHEGNPTFQTMLDGPRVDFAAHARAMGCAAEAVSSIDQLEAALERARHCDRTCVIVVETAPHAWTDAGGAFWQVGVPEVSDHPAVAEARARQDAGSRRQRRGV